MKTIVTILFIILCNVSFAQEINIEKYCKRIKTEFDKFEEQTEYTTPILKQIVFYKIITSDETIIYMRISTIGSTSATGEGVILLLENGGKITKDIRTSVRVNIKAQYVHSAFFRLNEIDIELLKKFNITDTRLYIFDMKIKNPIQYRAYMICLDEKQFSVRNFR